MIDKIFFFIMVPMVYLAIVWCVVGSVARIAAIFRRKSHPHTLKVFQPKGKGAGSALTDAFFMPQIRVHKPVLWIFLVAFHAALALLLLAHIDLIEGVNIMSADSPHMIGAGSVGAVLTVAILYLLFRRFRTPVRELSVPADYLMLFFLFCVFMTGDIISWGNSWNEGGFVITKVDHFKPYFKSLVEFSFKDPYELFDESSHYVVVVMHVLFANLFLMILPFSKIAHTFFAVPLNKLRRG